MARTTPLRLLTAVLAGLHVLTARHHLGDFFAHPSLADAWKGVGAAAAVALLALPTRVLARIASALWRRRALGAAVAVGLAVVHLVPATDHLPRLARALSFGDAWRGIGAAIAIAWFLAPRALQLGVVRRLAQRAIARGTAKLALATAAAFALLGACSQNGLQDGDAGGPDATSGGSCAPCVIDSDCPSGSVCAQLGGDSYCAATCAQQSDCQDGETCMSVVTISGDQAQTCVQTASATCGPNPTDDAGTTGSCPGFADPSTSAGCTSCTTQTRPDCQANGCYGGWYCNTQTNKCQAPPTNCNAPPAADGGAPPSFDGGVNANIGPNGGTESHLYFAIVGDTRPATEDDTAHYPTAIISKIFSDLSGLGTVPPFVVSTGDYQFSNPYGNQSSAQLQLYLNAKGSYPGVQFPAMGNHECTGGTASNCGSGNANGLTNNYNNFMSMMLGPIQKTAPYYAINVAANDNSWTAKFVFIAANAWDAAQSSWLDSTLSQSTTYTFVVRHEPASANTAPGVTPSETIMASHPYTLAIVGHSHEYYHSKYSSPRQVVIGNGGAPLATNQNYGYGIVAQRADGALTVDMYDYQSNQAVTSFHFAVKADGTLTN